MFELPVSKPALMLLVWLVWLGLFLPPACGAQQTQMHPVLVAACESTDGCARWDFHGPSGSGQWPNGAVADLTIQRFDANDGGTVVIRRVDSSGAASGLTAMAETELMESPIARTFVRSYVDPGHGLAAFARSTQVSHPGQSLALVGEPAMAVLRYGKVVR